jgi:SAM-dependent methyltransferase
VDPQQAALSAAYLASDDRLRQSGFSGGTERWERLRRPVADAIGRSGSLLDVGCANGALLEDVVAWCAARGVVVEPWGLDVSPDLVALARGRMPEWAHRLFVADVAGWVPSRRWDVVRTELVYVAAEERPALVGRLLADAVAPGGSLLVCSYTGRRDPAVPRVDDVLAADLRAWDFEPTRVLAGVDDDGTARAAVAVIPRTDFRDSLDFGPRGSGVTAATPDLGSGAFGRAGSTPASRTTAHRPACA